MLALGLTPNSVHSKAQLLNKMPAAQGRAPESPSRETHCDLQAGKELDDIKLNWSSGNLGAGATIQNRGITCSANQEKLSTMKGYKRQSSAPFSRHSRIFIKNTTRYCVTR